LFSQEAPETRLFCAKLAFAAPVISTLDPDFQGFVLSKIKPSYLVNLHYKGKRNWIWETEFQPYVFYYTGLVVAVTGTYALGPHGTNVVTGTDYVYQKLRFKYYKFQLGFGKQFGFKRGYTFYTAGLTGITGSLNDARIYMNIQTFDATSGKQINYGQKSEQEFDTLSIRNEFPRISPYVTFGGGYYLHKRLSLDAAINYCPVLIGKSESNWDMPGRSIYTLFMQHLFSISVGIRFNIAGENPVR
jgi:hypothetical protein